MNQFISLPSDLLKYIINYLNIKSLAMLYMSAKRMRRVIDSMQFTRYVKFDHGIIPYRGSYLAIRAALKNDLINQRIEREVNRCHDVSFAQNRHHQAVSHRCNQSFYRFASLCSLLPCFNSSENSEGHESQRLINRFL